MQLLSSVWFQISYSERVWADWFPTWFLGEHCVLKFVVQCKNMCILSARRSSIEQRLCSESLILQCFAKSMLAGVELFTASIHESTCICFAESYCADASLLKLALPCIE